MTTDLCVFIYLKCMETEQHTEKVQVGLSKF